MSNTTAEKKKLVGVFALWRKKSKNGGTYFSGKTEGGSFLTGFYVTDKKNLKEPDLRVYAKDSEGNLSEEPFCSLWCNATKNGKKILSGKLDGKRVIGFIKAEAKENQPYISVYYSDEEQNEEKEQSNKTDTKTEEKKTKPSKKKEEPEFEEIPGDEELPF